MPTTPANKKIKPKELKKVCLLNKLITSHMKPAIKRAIGKCTNTA